ncbi:hypothetical protein GCM10007301_55770 [Azorhizobium oxalatiphilum]|uniref:Uncharacterized protein n=1 Tax=Azorhizobium oxalatiphilum TaxID=980631 RepID=A0A917CGU8_9HYPH|nr:hypothetical protein [Azorhizobium oxalatiphilum]GGF88665.1 hypothetical protein GCM10007301_55770 [Azorhizobium oxalatiphilum]
MKSLALVAALATLIPVTVTSVHAQQTSDDVKWITQCVSDNKDEGQTAPVVLTYCTCMNNKMSSNETRSITQWEKANPRTMEACSQEAGWKGR